MKRLACFILLLCLIPVYAFGETLEDILPVFNRKARTCGASQLTGEYNRIQKSTYDMLEYKISESIYTGFMEKYGDIDSGYVVCVDPSSEGDFLALCAAHVLTICGDSDGEKAYRYILEMFLAARKKKETTETTIGNIVFGLFPISTGIAFNYTIIGK